MEVKFRVIQKVIILNVLLFGLLTGVVKAQTDTNSSTIWIVRSKSLVGIMVPCPVKVGNQKSFTLQNGQAAKFTVHSKGRVVITAGFYNEEEWLDVEPGKEYFVYLKISAKKVITVGEKPKKEEDWMTSPKFVFEEDMKYPISSSN